MVWSRLSAFVIALVAMAAAAANAHDIPNDITVQAFLKPEARRLRLLVRVPIDGLRDMGVPTNPQGVMDLARLDPLLGDNVMLWIGQNIDVFESDARLPSPRLRGWRLSLPADRSFTSFDGSSDLLLQRLVMAVHDEHPSAGGLWPLGGACRCQDTLAVER